MNKLKEILNFVKPSKKFDDTEYFAKQFTRTLTMMGYESYDVWQIAERMLEYSLNPQDNPELFTPYQRIQRKVYPSE